MGKGRCRLLPSVHCMVMVCMYFYSLSGVFEIFTPKGDRGFQSFLPKGGYSLMNLWDLFLIFPGVGSLV